MRHLTNSEVQISQRCWRKWYLSQFRRLVARSERINESRFLGDLVHAALAEMYGLGQDPIAVVTLICAQHTQAQEDMLTDALEGGVVIIEENIRIIESARKFAVLMIEGYMEWLQEEGADSYLSVVGAEAEVSVLLPVDSLPQPVTLLSKQDLKVLDQRTNARCFLDHKTVDKFGDRTRWAHLDPQFYFYSLVDYLLASIDQQQNQTEEIIWTDGGILNMLRKVKRTARATPPFYMRHEVRHTMIELQNYFIRLTGLATKILQAEELLTNGVDHKLACPPNPTRDCVWDCQFFALCGMMDDGSDSEGYIEATYKLGDPMARYLQTVTE